MTGVNLLNAVFAHGLQNLYFAHAASRASRHASCVLRSLSIKAQMFDLYFCHLVAAQNIQIRL